MFLGGWWGNAKCTAEEWNRETTFLASLRNRINEREKGGGENVWNITFASDRGW